MTRYSIDRGRSMITASWHDGHCDISSDVMGIPEGIEDDRLTLVVLAMSALSEAIWNRYMCPASAVDSPVGNTHSEAHYRQQDRENFGFALTAIEDPDAERPVLRPSDEPLRVPLYGLALGGHLREAGIAGFTKRVAEEMAREIEAVEHAERGEYQVGRAAQALRLSRAEVSPGQVIEADRIMERSPLNPYPVIADMDPASASVAAMHWLIAAAAVSAKAAGLELPAVPMAASRLGAIQYQVPSLVLAGYGSRDSLTEYAVDMIDTGVRAMKGEFVHPAEALRLAENMMSVAQTLDIDDPVDREAILKTVRVSDLAPEAPAVDLRDLMVNGIHGCLLVYQAHTGSTGDEAFLAAVRAEAAAHHERIL